MTSHPVILTCRNRVWLAHVKPALQRPAVRLTIENAWRGPTSHVQFGPTSDPAPRPLVREAARQMLDQATAGIRRSQVFPFIGASAPCLLVRLLMTAHL